MPEQASKTLAKTKQIARLIQFLKDVRSEVAKVTWPGGNEVKGATAVVIVVCIIVALVIWILDWIINSGLGFIF